MKRVIFVGLHNKTGMKPLDSKTKSGKLIDRIIKKCSGINILKTNLCDIDYFPKDKKLIWACNLEWNERQQPTSDTVIVLLGGWVQKNFLLTEAKIIKIAHPASKRSHVDMDDYVEKTF